MDKHDRPYKCLEPGCDKVQGFTYSGGLLRHQREVHKKNKSTGKELYCPYPDCNRSKSQSFTRKENLKEHIRRRHVPGDAMVSPGTQSTIATPTTPPRPVQNRSLKRKRTTSTDLDDELQSSEEGTDEEEGSEPVKRLKQMIRDRDTRIRDKDIRIGMLERELHAIKQRLLVTRSLAET